MRRTSNNKSEKRACGPPSDLYNLSANCGPDAATLAAAPLIEDWFLATHPVAGVSCLCGGISGHPGGIQGFATTSPVVALDPDLRWARTISRFYRLGRRAPFRIVGGDGE
jgi:hypothetical protein